MDLPYWSLDRRAGVALLCGRSSKVGAAVTSVSAFVDFSITVCGIAELAGHGAVGVTHVLSLLDPGFPDPEAFSQFGEHERLALRFHDIVDAQPSMRLVQRE